MNTLNRRQFLKLAGAMSALAVTPRAIGQTTTAPRVVVVGGGFGGATLAKYVRMWGGNVQGPFAAPGTYQGSDDAHSAAQRLYSLQQNNHTWDESSSGSHVKGLDAAWI